MTTDLPEPAPLRFTGISAILFALVPLPVLLVPHESMKDSFGGDDINAFFQQHWTMQQWQTLMHIASALFLLAFVVGLYRILRSTARSRTFPMLALVSGSIIVVQVVVSMAVVSSSIALLHLEQTGPPTDPTIAAAFYYLGWDLHFKVNYVVPLFLAVAAWAGWQGQSLSRAWGVITAGVALLTAASAVATLWQPSYVAQYPAFMLFMAWSLGTGVMFLARSGRLKPSAVARAGSRTPEVAL